MLGHLVGDRLIGCRRVEGVALLEKFVSSVHQRLKLARDIVLCAILVVIPIAAHVERRRCLSLIEFRIHVLFFVLARRHWLSTSDSSSGTRTIICSTSAIS